MKKVGFGIGAIISLIILVVCFTYIGLNLGDAYMFDKKPIIMGSQDFEPGIKQYSLCIAERVDENNRNDIKEGDTVLYKMWLGDRPVITCGNVQEAGQTRLTLTTPSNTELVNIVKRTDVKSEITKHYGFTAPFFKVFTNKFVFFPIMLICVIVDVLWVLLFIRRKMEER